MKKSSGGNYLVYIAFGGIDFRNEVKSSILSLFLKCDRQEPIDIIVYTDNAHDFRDVFDSSFPLIYEEVSDKQFQDWKGSINFIHRIKIEVILHAMVKYGGNILYLDSDTYFLNDPTPIFNALTAGKRFMHLYESTLHTSAGFHRKLFEKLVHKTSPSVSEALGKTKMFNAGVIGLTSKDIPLVKDVIVKTEAFYRIYPAHVMEQLSFSMCLGEAGAVQEAAPYILHYWHMKDARQALAIFFRQNANCAPGEMLEAYSRFPILSAAETKTAWEQKPRWQRGVLRIIGRNWKWPA